MAAMMTTKELARELGAHPSTVYQWGHKYGCPCWKTFFPPSTGRGGSKRGIGWDPDDVKAWLRSTGRMTRDNVLTCLRPERWKVNRKGYKEAVLLPSPKPVKAPADPLSGFPPLTKNCPPGLQRLALGHLLGAFAHACQGGGIPIDLQRQLEDRGINEMRAEALDIIEEMAQATLRTASQWTEIKQAIPALSGPAGKTKGKANK